MSTSKKTPTSKEPKSLEPSRDFGGVQSQGGRPYQEDSFGFSSFDNGDGATEGLLMVLEDGTNRQRVRSLTACVMALRLCSRRWH